MAPKTLCCNRCKRPWATTLNPIVENPEPTDLLKKRGTSSTCQPCYSYCQREPEFAELSASEILAKINEDQDKYNQGLAGYEEQRRGHKRRNPEHETSVKAETRAAVSTRKLLGYLWPQALLRSHSVPELWQKLPKQTVQHFGHSVTGVLRDCNTLGAIEVYETSEVAAVRGHEVCNREQAEQEEAEDAFDNLQKSLKVSTVSHDGDEADGEGGFSLKQKKAKKGAEADDFMSLWGVGGLGTSGGASSSRGPEDDEEGEARRHGKTRPKPKADADGNRRSKAAKKAAGTATGNASASLTSLGQNHVPDDAASQAEELAQSSGKGSRELEATERVLQQYNSLAGNFADEAQFMAVTFKQVSTVQTKLEARNSVDLQKLYRELSTTGNETQKAIDILQRLTKAVSEVGTLGQIVAAIHGEATAATLKELMAEGDSMGLQLPASLAKMQSARALVELSVGGEWERYLALLQGGEIASLFGDDKDGLADFQFCSLKNSVCKWLQQETAVPSSTEPKATDGKAQVVTEEQKAERERQHREATKARAVELTKHLQQFLQQLAESTVHQALGGYPGFASFLEELGSLKKVTDVAAQGDDFVIGVDEVEPLKSARQMILTKRGSFAEGLTLFPVGLFIQQSCNMAIEAVCRDRGFSSDLDACLVSCTVLKTFTTDVLMKPDSHDIVVPGQAKVIEIVQKLQLIEAAASNHFKQEKASTIALVEAKITELATALWQVSVDKFQKVCLTDDFASKLTSLVAGKLLPEAAVRLTEQLTACKSFVPASQALFQKTLGLQAKPIIEKFSSLRNFFGSVVAALPHMMSLFEDVATKAGQFNSCRLLQAELVNLVTTWNDEIVMKSTKELLGEKFAALTSEMMLEIGKDAMHLGCRLVLAGEASSFRRFVAFMCQMNDPEKVLLKDIVGEFHNDDDKVMVDYSAIFKIYKHSFPQGWFPMTIPSASGSDVEIQVSPASLCSAGAMLPLAKMIVHMTTWLSDVTAAPATSKCIMASPAQGEQCYEKCILALVAAKEHEPGKLAHALRRGFAAAEATGHDLAATFVRGCAAKVCKFFSSLVSLIHKDFDALRDELVKSYKNMEGLSQFEELVGQGHVDPKITTQLCESRNLQMLYHMLAYGLPSVQGAQKFLRAIAGATAHADFKDDDGFISIRQAVHDEIQNFKAFLECEPSDSLPVVMSSISFTIGNATIAQSCTRPLKTGETRQGLVNRAQGGVKKRGWKIHPSLQQRVANVLNGKTGVK
ncbi:unnamed protein product [Symbiodinium microadriaticum]|nr:unnamed protein product [Symbiodinium microadriaticum]